ncbi:hypothetical protein CEK26_004671 [Fusarium fujikuroi]|nr:hypothetical protein CEK27_004671 [Fusarium fujikuroi]QGI91602.1 hypothetical protein CEK26_004671 [Fusarium fujikuroi]
MVVGEYMFLPQAWPKIGPFTKLIVVVTVFLPYLFLYLACAADPGYITPENHAYYMSLYPYDHTLFHPGHMCRTCKFLKPARSKHCSLCKRCVAKADHHCVFINSCVGYGNQHWFILLLISTAFLCTYGGFLGLSIITVRVQRYAPGWSVWKPRGMTVSQYLAGWGWGIQDNVNMGASSLLAALTSPLVWGLLLYTLYLVYCGTTTNETLKWSDWKEDMRDGFAFRRSMPINRQKNERAEPRFTRWPVEVQQIMVTTQDGQPPNDDLRYPGEGEWERVWNLSDVENLYDMGLWDNLVDIFVLLNSLDRLLQQGRKFLLLDKSHAHTVAPEEHDPILGVAQVIELIGVQQVFFLDGFVETWDLGLHDAPRDPVSMIGRAPLSCLLQQLSHALVAPFVVGPFRGAPSSRWYSRIKHELDDGA